MGEILTTTVGFSPAADLDALRGWDEEIGVGVGVVDIKVNPVETAEEIVRSVVEWKTAAPVQGRHLFLSW